jgi:hypothetical protein
VSRKQKTEEWVLLSENEDAVLSALERGETDGMVPAGSATMDRFAKFLSESGIARILDGFADHRERKSIPAFLFCNLLLHKSLLNIGSLSQIGPILFSSPDTLRMLGFNMRQIQEGFYSGGTQRPMDVESIGDFFANCDLKDFLINQKMVLKRLLDAYPELLAEGTLVMDCVEFAIPAGRANKTRQNQEACVLCSARDGEALPLLWSFIEGKTQADITQGKALIDEVLSIVDKRAKRLVVDRGFLSGKWVGELKEKGIDTVIGLKTDMELYTDMLSLASETDTSWLEVDLPKYKNSKRVPISRKIAYLSDLETWDSCKVPLAGLVIRDTYSDGEVVYQCVVTTDLTAEPEQIHAWIRGRWAIEETFMRESRYGSLNKIGPCRVSVGAAIAHFSFLVFTLLRLFANQEREERSLPRFVVPSAGLEMVAYWSDYYAITQMSRLLTIILGRPPDIQRAVQARQEAFEKAMTRPR